MAEKPNKRTVKLPEISREPIATTGGSDGNPDAILDGATIINTSALDAPAASGAASEAGESKRGRGRPKGSGTKSAGQSETKSPQVDLSSFNSLLYSCHLLLSHAVKTPEIALDETESKKLAEAAANVARHYNVGASQKTMDWGNFIMALCIIYGPRIVAVNQRHKTEASEKKAAKQQQAAQSSPFGLGANA